MSPAQASGKVLCIQWSDREDVFRFASEDLKESVLSSKLTKRVLLEALSRLYDPAGFIPPNTMQLNVILQSVHKEKCGLDAPLSPDIAR